MVDMRSPFEGTVLASDASTRGGGVTYAHMSPEESRKMAQQHGGDGWYTSRSPDHRAKRLEMAPEKIAVVDSLTWRTAISTRWKFKCHINVLEAQAVLLALRWYADNVLMCTLPRPDQIWLAARLACPEDWLDLRQQ
jgi:hypothetical protein